MNLHLRWFPECQRLHEFHMVSIVTVNSGKRGFSHLSQLLFSEFSRVAGTVIVEPVSMLESYKLVTNNTSKSGAKKSSWHRGFTHSSNEKINVINMVIDKL